MTYTHCMHPAGVMPTSELDVRLCCWCGMKQHAGSRPDLSHGPHVRIVSYDWRPSSQEKCDEATAARGYRQPDAVSVAHPV